MKTFGATAAPAAARASQPARSRSSQSVTAVHGRLVLLALLAQLAADGATARESALVRQLLESDELLKLPADSVRVEINVAMQNFEYLSTIDRKYKVQLLLRMSWPDERLQHSYPAGFVTLPAAKIWTPDLYFANELRRSADGHTLHGGTRTARVSSAGDVRLHRQVTVELSCPMDLRNYPFDTQKCPLTLTSWSTPASQLRLRWSRLPLTLTRHVLEVSDFRLATFATENCSMSTTTDVFPCLHGDFVMSRMVSPHVVRLFVPLAMCAFVACLSYWIACSPVRVTLLMVDFMVAMLLVHFTAYSSPITDYTKYSDVFSGVAMTFVAVALFEFVLVQNVYKRELTNDKVHSMMNDIRPNWLDNVCRFLMPALFVLFAALYFGVAFWQRLSGEGEHTAD